MNIRLRRWLTMMVSMVLLFSSQAFALMMAPELNPSAALVPVALGVITLFIVGDRFRRGALSVEPEPSF